MDVRIHWAEVCLLVCLLHAVHILSPTSPLHFINFYQTTCEGGTLMSHWMSAEAAHPCDSEVQSACPERARSELARPGEGRRKGEMISWGL